MVKAFGFPLLKITFSHFFPHFPTGALPFSYLLIYLDSSSVTHTFIPHFFSFFPSPFLLSFFVMRSPVFPVPC